ncbi:hypothetical protein GQ457_05G006680 [Hibiscus cannabinus]
MSSKFIDNFYTGKVKDGDCKYILYLVKDQHQNYNSPQYQQHSQKCSPVFNFVIGQDAGCALALLHLEHQSEDEEEQDAGSLPQLLVVTAAVQPNKPSS